jgi:preprotein translocase subunit SecY
LIGGFQNIGKIPELKRRVLLTFALLAVYRIGVFIPSPGIDTGLMEQFFSAQGQGTLFGLIDMFSGGALRRFSIFALGIMPYISASIILQLLTVVVPHLERLSKEGEAGRKKITQYTRYGTVVLSLIQGFGISIGLKQMQVGGAFVVSPEAGMGFHLMTMITLTAGTAFIMWLGEQITERGVGNGISLIIFAGIVAEIPGALVKVFAMMSLGEINLFLALFVLALVVGVVAAIILVERGQRRIPVQYAKKVVGRRMYGGQSTHLPLRVNTSGVIPPIFASSVLMFPLTIAQFVTPDFREAHPFIQSLLDMMSPAHLVYNLLYVALIIFFCYFYTAVTFNPVDVADNMRRYGGYIPGIRPGKPTAEFIDRVLTRVTFGGAMYLAAVCVLPQFLIAEFNVPFYFGGTGLLIVVGVALDTMAQIESHMLTRHYEGFLKSGRLKGRGGR